MKITRLDWNDRRVEHIVRHDVDPDEVWEICEDPRHRVRKQGQDRYLLYGQTYAGRYLFVVLEYLEHGIFAPITARDMTDGEKKNFRRLQ